MGDGHSCSFFTDKSNIGPLCFTSLVIGFCFGIGLMIVRSRKEHKTYESVHRSATVRREYRNLRNIFYNNELQENDASGPSQSLEINTQITPEWNNKSRSAYMNLNDQENYLDPVVHNRQSNYLTPFQNVCDPHNLYVNKASGLKREAKNPK